MYSIFELTIMGIIVLASVIGGIAVLATIGQRRNYIRLGEGIKIAVLTLMIVGYLLWFGFLGRTIGSGLMTVTTWITVMWKLGEFLGELGHIENASVATVRTPAKIAWDTVSTLVQVAGVSLMFGLALAYGG